MKLVTRKLYDIMYNILSEINSLDYVAFRVNCKQMSMSFQTITKARF